MKRTADNRGTARDGDEGWGGVGADGKIYGWDC